MKRLFLLIPLILCGCGPTLISTRGGSSSVYAPANEAKGGTVKYERNREGAYKKMYDYCQGTYSIVSERHFSEPYQSQNYVTGAIYNDSTDYTYIDFECIQ